MDRAAATSPSETRDAIAALGTQWPAVPDRVLETESIRFLQGLDTPLADGATIVIVPAVSGG